MDTEQTELMVRMSSSSDNQRDSPVAAIPPLQTPESFPFPYVKPYDIQVDLMRVVFEAIESGKIAIVSDAGEGLLAYILTTSSGRVADRYWKVAYTIDVDFDLAKS